MTRALELRRQHVAGLARGLGDPQALLEGLVQRLDDRAERLELAMRGGLERRGVAVRQLALKLRHPRDVLQMARLRLETGGRGLRAGLATATRLADSRYQALAQRLNLDYLRRDLGKASERLADLPPRLDRAYAARLRAGGDKLANLSQLLESYSYRGVLARGFALVTDGDGAPITRADATHPGMAVAIAFADGKVAALIGDPGTLPAAAEPETDNRPSPRKRGPRPPIDQGSLF
jgi:exodeoxyribonuclease VII large subunit